MNLEIISLPSPSAWGIGPISKLKSADKAPFHKRIVCVAQS